MKGITVALQNDYKFQKAFELVKAGLESGSIKLIGPAVPSQASANGNGDAHYLKSLLETLSNALPAAD